jgi:hypothetical protein
LLGMFRVTINAQVDCKTNEIHNHNEQAVRANHVA